MVWQIMCSMEVAWKGIYLSVCIVMDDVELPNEIWSNGKECTNLLSTFASELPFKMKHILKSITNLMPLLFHSQILKFVLTVNILQVDWKMSVS